MNLLWLAELVQDGLRNLVRHKLRSTLTLLGVVFGVAAVITMLGIGEGAQRTVLREIEGLGLRNIIVDSTRPPASALSSQEASYRILQYGITERDVAQVRAICAHSQLAAGHLVKQSVYFGSQRLDTHVLGVSPEYFQLFATERLAGRLLSAADERDGHRVAVVSETVAEHIRAAGGPVGRTIRIGRSYWTVAGVIRISSRNTDLTLLPYSAAKRAFGTTTVKREGGGMEFTKTEIGQLVVHVRNEQDIPATAKLVRRTFQRGHEHPDYTITVPLDILRSKQRTQRILNLVLVTIAAISLVVGGIGIMNIMLAIVTERIPEIGIRRAIGARRKDILLQFLMETVTLSSLGGLLGCLIGCACVPLASYWTRWTGVVTPFAVIVSLAVSWAVGLVFGIAPALRAARMNPVEALRYE